MKDLLKYLKPYRKECIIAPLFKMIEATFELFIPIVVSYIITEGIGMKNTSAIIWSIVIMVSLAIIGYIFAITAQYFSAKAAIGFSKGVTDDLYEHIQTLSFADLDKIGINSLITNMSSDITQMQTGVNMFLRLVLRSLFVVVGAVVMAFVVNPETAYIFVIIVPVLAIFVFLLTYLSIPLIKKAQVKLTTLLKKTRDNLGGVRVIRAFNLEETESKSFKQSNDDFTSFQIFVGKINSLLNPITFVLINLGIIGIIYVGGIQVNSGIISNGDVVAQYNYMSQILIELIKFANFTITINKAIACSKRVGSVFQIKNTQYFPTESIISNDSDIAVEMNNCALCYPNNLSNSIEGVNLKVKKGETVGIIGGTGSGKTSLINLLPRFYDLTEGTIELFGNDINSYSKKDLRKMVGTVLQNNILFNGTILENLKMANNPTDEEIKKALEIAQALDVINSKKEGLNATVNQGGTNFSGGQKQRLAIARTLISNPKILILDDSSSALDYLTDKNLRENIKKLNKDITLFIVSSRIASIIDADKIVVLDEGKVMGIDTHQNLLNNCQVYKQIYLSQYEKEGL